MKRPKRITLHYTKRRLLMDSIKDFALCTPFELSVLQKLDKVGYQLTDKRKR